MKKIRIEEVFDALPTIEDLDKPQAMIEKWGTSPHLSKVCRMTGPNVVANLAKLKKADRAHVHAWASGAQAPVWVKGAGENAPRPSAPADELRQRARERVVKSREKKREEKAQKESARATTSTNPTIERARQQKRDPFASLYDPVPGQS
jgi:hypothetical protein